MPENVPKRQKSKDFMTLPAQLWSNADRYLYVNRTVKQVVHKLCEKCWWKKDTNNSWINYDAIAIP